MNIEDLRKQYKQSNLRKASMASDPFQQFEKWFAEATETCPEFMERNAMTLSTSSPDGHVTSRVVLLKAINDEGLVFFTNYDSQKGQQLLTNARASLLFYWPQLERQVRIDGKTVKTDRQRSIDYFQKRPRASQISAAISEQSEVVENRAELEQRAAELEKSLNGAAVPTPENWGGFVLTPYIFEFWQGGADRLHDRIRYRLEQSAWILERLQP